MLKWSYQIIEYYFEYCPCYIFESSETKSTLIDPKRDQVELQDRDQNYTIMTPSASECELRVVLRDIIHEKKNLSLLILLIY